MSTIGRVGKTLLPHDDYVASLPRKRMAVAALIRDAYGRALLVSPTYEDSWLVPGGVVDADESPHAACRREVTEEIGLSLPPGRILAVDWTPQDPNWPEGVFFVYDGGTLSEADIASITVQDDELHGFRFAAQGAIASLLNPPLARRIESAFVALRTGSVLSLEEGKPIKLAAWMPLRRGTSVQGRGQKSSPWTGMLLFAVRPAIFARAARSLNWGCSSAARMSRKNTSAVTSTSAPARWRSGGCGMA
jgi:ADP-ribose pyrophosphatase YjhB (NUDIX family)